MFQTWDNSQLLRRVLWISAEQTIGASLKHKNTQPLYIFSRVRVLHLNRLKEWTWLHSFGSSSSSSSKKASTVKQPLWGTVEKTNKTELWNRSNSHFWGWHENLFFSNEEFRGRNSNFFFLRLKAGFFFFFWAHVITQGICNKFIGSKFSVGCMVWSWC